MEENRYIAIAEKQEKVKYPENRIDNLFNQYIMASCIEEARSKLARKHYKDSIKGDLGRMRIFSFDTWEEPVEVDNRDELHDCENHLMGTAEPGEITAEGDLIKKAVCGSCNAKYSIYFNRGHITARE